VTDKTIADACNESPNVDDYVRLANATVLRLDQENGKLKGALRDCLLLAMRELHKNPDSQFKHVLRFCERAGVTPSPLRTT
jgi:hypothetical protein